MFRRVRTFAGLTGLVFAFLQMALPAVAQTPESESGSANTLTVATKQAPPFAMKEPQGAWSGLAIDLMDEIARRLNAKLAWTEAGSTAELLEISAQKRADAAIAAITVTSEREKAVDFTHSYYESGLAIAVRKKHSASFWAGLRALTSPAFLGTVGMLVALLLFTGALVWLIESRHNSDQFERHPFRGIGSGFWWAAVTMTTVGYGDKAPVTPLGRVVAVIWMFAALILTAVFIAQLSSALTLHRMTGPVTGIGDLPHSRVGIVERTASAPYFASRSILTSPYPSVEAGLRALVDGRINAFVHDEPILRFDVRQQMPDELEILPDVFDEQFYAIALPPGSSLREPINQALLDILASPVWTSMKEKYFGRSNPGS